MNYIILSSKIGPLKLILMKDTKPPLFQHFVINKRNINPFWFSVNSEADVIWIIWIIPGVNHYYFFLFKRPPFSSWGHSLNALRSNFNRRLLSFFFSTIIINHFDLFLSKIFLEWGTIHCVTIFNGNGVDILCLSALLNNQILGIELWICLKKWNPQRIYENT